MVAGKGERLREFVDEAQGPIVRICRQGQVVVVGRVAGKGERLKKG